MSFYDLSESERIVKKEEIGAAIERSITENMPSDILPIFNDSDTYIRKAAYQSVGKLYNGNAALRLKILDWLMALLQSEHENVRQTVVYAAGEIALKDFSAAQSVLERGLADPHHSVRNAVTGSLKNAGSKNPAAIEFCEKHLQSPDPETRRLVCHGLELRGRTHPQEILPLIKVLQFDQNKRVKDMLIHVLGQISYKKGCFHIVEQEVAGWENKDIYPAFAEEAIEVHGRYEKFSELTQAQVKEYFRG